MRRLAEIIGEATGRQPVIEAIPEIMEDTYRLVADTRKLQSLGYTPPMSLLDGVREIATQLGEYPELPNGTTIFKRGQRGEEAESGRLHSPLAGRKL